MNADGESFALYLGVPLAPALGYSCRVQTPDKSTNFCALTSLFRSLAHTHAHTHLHRLTPSFCLSLSLTHTHTLFLSFIYGHIQAYTDVHTLYTPTPTHTRTLTLTGTLSVTPPIHPVYMMSTRRVTQFRVSTLRQ